MTIEIVNHTDHPVEICNFDKSRYVDPGFMEREWDGVWRKTWLLAGLVSDLERPGDFFVFDMGREQILIARTSKGSIQGFFNVCQHRGNRLVTQECGHADSFRCAYHAWTYNVDGELAAVPYEERFADGVPRKERALKPVHTDVWSGFVFINMGEDPEPLDEFLCGVPGFLDPYRFGHMTLVEHQTVHLDCNWKAVVDNFSELYHVDFLHPQHKRMVDCCNDTVHLFPNGHTGLAVPGATVNPRFPVPDEPTDIQTGQLMNLGLDPTDYVGRVMEIRRAVQLRKREIGADRGYHYDQFDDEQLSDVWQYNLFPNTIFSFTPEHLWILRPRPHPTDPNRCEFDKYTLVMFADPELVTGSDDIVSIGRASTRIEGVQPEGLKRPQRDVFSYEAVIAGKKTMTDTIDQDVELLSGVQAGMRSEGFDTTWLNDDEMRIQHFHNHLVLLVGD